MSKLKVARKVTCQLLTMMDNGDIDPFAVTHACLNYMSEYDVAIMADSEGLIPEDEQDDDDEPVKDDANEEDDE